MILFSFNRVNSTIITIIKRLIQTQRYMYIHIGMLMFSFFLNDRFAMKTTTKNQKQNDRF